MKTAAAFAKGFLEMLRDLTPIHTSVCMMVVTTVFIMMKTREYTGNGAGSRVPPHSQQTNRALSAAWCRACKQGYKIMRALNSGALHAGSGGVAHGPLAAAKSRACL
jgi:hypothetical protein